MTLTSTANPRVRAALALRDRRDREQTGLTVVHGAREVLRAVRAGVRIRELFVCHERCGDPACAEIVAAVPDSTPVSPAVIDRLAYGARSEGVVAVVEVPSTLLSELRLPSEPLVVVLDRVEKPGNLGAVVRSADAAGADAVLVSDPRTDAFNPNAIRASVGTVFSVPIASASEAVVRSFLSERGIRVLAARVEADLDYTRADLRGRVAIVLGSEAEGLGAGWTGDDVTAIRLPMHGVADSLNVSAAAAVLLYEARRQRGG
jgi:TrmH family RNA methyltransferase